MKRIIAVGAAVLALAGCNRAPDTGVVLDRDHDGPWVQIIPGIPPQTSCSGSPVRCSTTPGTPQQTIYHNDEWQLKIRSDDGRREGWRSVRESEYDACDRQEHWPECTQPKA